MDVGGNPNPKGFEQWMARGIRTHESLDLWARVTWSWPQKEENYSIDADAVAGTSDYKSGLKFPNKARALKTTFSAGVDS